MKILITAIGTAGDVLPLAGLGCALKRRGNIVAFAATPDFAGVARSAGLEFHALDGIPGTSGHPDLYHPVRGMQVVADRLLIPALDPVYRLLRHFDASEWSILDNGYAFAARVAQEKLGFRVTTCMVSPICLRSLESMPVNPGINLPRWAPMFLRRSFNSMIARMWDRRLAPALNGFRRQLGLAPVDSIWYDWRLSPERVIGLFPEWFAPAPSDWPRQFVQGGFTVFDQGMGDGVPGVLSTPGAPIVVFTAGSARDAAADFFQAALEASHGRPWRTVLLTAGYSPRTLHRGRKICPGAYLFDYLPLSELLPYSSLVVHHGGLGTLSLAARTATPQLVVPFGHDQFDNAARVERLGLGRSVRNGRGLASRLGDAIEAMLSQPKYASRCEAVARRAASDEWLDRICRQIESDEGRFIPVGCRSVDRQAV